MLWLLLFVCIHQTCAVIYRLSASDYYQMPPVYHLDPFEPCIQEPGGIYCSSEFVLTSDEPSELLTLIQEYSEHTITHFNHTKLRYGICLTKTCKNNFLPDKTDLKSVLEACLNETLWNDYKLKSKIIGNLTCHRYSDTVQIETADRFVANICLILLMLNFIGSIYGFFWATDKNKIGNDMLLCFSISHNWEMLVAPRSESPDRAQLRGIDGLRFLTNMLVILGHAFIPSAITVDNGQYYEEMFYNPGYQIFFNGTLIVQTFLVLSGFLMMLKFLKVTENQKINWSILPKGIITRWLRLTPTYALVLAITATWMRFIGSGPQWTRAVEMEVKDCQQFWWQHLLFFNNYIDNSQCMVQTWYLAVDMQLHILGLIILVMFTTSRSRKIALGAILAVGVLAPGIHTYVQNLNAVLIVSPEVTANFFVSDPTFNNVYKRGHTNIPNFILGLAAGWLVYNWQKTKADLSQFKKYRYLYWTLFPAILGIILLGSVFYWDGPQPELYLRTVYAALVKPCFGMCVVLLLLGMICKVEDVYRGILEWPGWSSLSRLTYCAYLIHIIPIRTVSGLKTTLTHLSFIQVVTDMFGLFCISFLAAVLLWLMVENPFTQVINMFFSPKPHPDKPVDCKKSKDFNSNEVNMKTAMNGKGNK